MRRRRFGGRKSAKEEMVLQITSMADIFTIILVFLLKSFSTGISGITPNVMLPEAKASDEMMETLKVEIAENSILLDGVPVTVLHGYQFEAGDLESDLTPRSLNAALVMQKEKASARNPASVRDNTKLMILADEKTPYKTLKTVMTASSQQGFADFKLLVVEDQ